MRRLDACTKTRFVHQSMHLVHVTHRKTGHVSCIDQTTMELTPREKDKLLIFTAALLAERRQARGLKLNYPEAIAITRDGKELWVGDHSGPRVRVIDLATGTVAATLPTDPFAIRLAITPDGKTAVASNFQSGTLSLFDVRTRRPLRTIKLSGSAKAMQVAARVQAARDLQTERYAAHNAAQQSSAPVRSNAEADGAERATAPECGGEQGSGDRSGKADQQPAADFGIGRQEAEIDAGIPRHPEVEKGDEVDRLYHAQVHLLDDQPFRELIDRHDQHQGDKRPGDIAPENGAGRKWRKKLHAERTSRLEAAGQAVGRRATSRCGKCGKAQRRKRRVMPGGCVLRFSRKENPCSS